MKTIKQVKKDYKEYEKLINAVLKSIDKNDIENINNHGIDGGYGNFVNYSDTVPFAHRNQKQIIELLECDADDFSQDVVGMVGGFGLFRRNPMDAGDKQELYRFLSGVKCKETLIPNLMAWYAAETVCRWFEE